MSTRHLIGALGALLTAGVLGACGSSGSNGVASKPPNEIVSTAQSTAQGATSVHLSGSGTTSGQPVQLDLNLVNGKGGSGTVGVAGYTVNVVEVGQTVYVEAGSGFWQHFVGGSAAQLLANKWLKGPASSSSLASFSQFTNLNQLFGKLFASHGTLSKGSTTRVNGQDAVAVNDTTNHDTLYVATSGKPYPVALRKTGNGGGQLNFSNWNAPVTLTAPKNAVDLSQFGQ